MQLPEQLLTDIKESAQLATITSDPVRMRNAANWLAIIAEQIAAHVDLHIAKAAFNNDGREF